MRRRERAAWAAKVGLFLLTGPVWASAQQYTNPAATPKPGATLLNPAMVYGNPAANPFLNPYLNPYGYGTAGTADKTVTGYYLFQMTQANGGLGSGQVSGVRPGAKTPKAAKAQKAEPEAKDADPVARTSGRGVGTYPVNSTAPAAGASRYFNRGVPNNQSYTGSFYNRGRPAAKRKTN